MKRISITRPPLRYFGGKFKIARWIIDHFPPHKIYVEPFGGGANVLLKKEPVFAEVYNDLDAEVVNVFRVLRDKKKSKRLKELLLMTPFSREEHRLAFRFTQCELEKARRTIIKSYMSFGNDGIKRGNFKARVNDKSNSNLTLWKEFPKMINHFTSRLQGVVIENRCAFKIIEKYKENKNCLYYIDPPYMSSVRNNTKHSYQYEMSDQEHERLLKILKKVAGMVVISGYKTEMYQEYLSTWKREAKQTRAFDNSLREEFIWMNETCSDATSQMSF